MDLVCLNELEILPEAMYFHHLSVNRFFPCCTL